MQMSENNHYECLVSKKIGARRTVPPCLVLCLRFISTLKWMVLAVTWVVLAPVQAQSTPSGFNELSIMSHLWFVTTNYRTNDLWVMDGCPRNMPMMPANKTADLLYNFELNGSKVTVFRDIVPLQLIEPIQGSYPLDSEICSVLKTFANRNVELILAFAVPEPPWFSDSSLQGAIINGGDVRMAEMEVIANTIGSFLNRMEAQGLDTNWMQTKLRIEPMNEFNGAIDGRANYAGVLDTYMRLKKNSMAYKCKDILPSSIVSGDEFDYLNWFQVYWSAGGLGSPNIHLYQNAADTNNFEATLARFDRIVSRMQNTNSVNTNTHVVIGEIGFPSAGLGQGQMSIDNHSRFLSSVLSIPSVQTASRVVFWRIYDNWFPNWTVTDANTDPLTARELTYGFINYNTNVPEPEMKTYYLPGELVIAPSGSAQVAVIWPRTASALQSATNVAGPYADVLGATSPYTNTAADMMFFRLRH